MEYSIGQVGRVVAARFHDGEDVYAGIQAVAARESISSAVVYVVGGAKCAKVVVGPRDLQGPLVPLTREFDDAREIVGVGTLHMAEGKPALHLHGAIGRGEETIVGCPRLGLEAYLVLEVIIFELLGLDALRQLDPATGLHLLAFAKPKRV